MTDIPILTNWKSESYNLILVIVDSFTKIIYYELVKVTMDVLGLIEVIINVIVCYHRVSELIITD